MAIILVLLLFPAVATAYGALYNLYAIDVTSNGGKNVCPSGWHVPSDAEWTTLTTYLGGLDVAGGKLKEAGTAHWESPNTDAINENGFTAIPGGMHDINGFFYSIGQYGLWWSSTESSTTDAFYRSIYYCYAYVIRSNFFKQDGLSVRCVRD